MNILQISRYYYPNIGGIQEVVRSIAEGLSTNHNLRVLCAQPRGFGETTEINSIPTRRVTSFGEIFSTPVSPTFPLRFWQEARNAEVIHHHLPNPLSVLSSALVPSVQPNTIVTYHSDIVRQASLLPVYQKFLHKFLDGSDRIIVTSPRLLEHSEHLQPFKSKCTVVPLSINLDEYGEVEDSAQLPLYKQDSPLILFVGRLNYYKGVEYLIESMETVDANLAIVGDGPRRSRLEERVVELDLGDKIDFFGKVSKEDLKSWYSKADIFALPSVEPSEAFGIVQLEAMAYRTPVVNTDLPTGVPWVSIDGETGITVPPRNSSALSNALTTLVSNERVRQKYGDAARERVEQQFSRDQMVSDIEDIYRSVSGD